jgi:hypothetical protein
MMEWWNDVNFQQSNNPTIQQNSIFTAPENN